MRRVTSPTVFDFEDTPNKAVREVVKWALGLRLRDQITDQDLDEFLKWLLAAYLGRTIEDRFEAKMDVWTERFTRRLMTDFGKL